MDAFNTTMMLKPERPFKPVCQNARANSQQKTVGMFDDIVTLSEHILEGNYRSYG